MEIDYDKFFTMLVFGAPDSGKSTLIRHLVHKGAIQNKFDHVILFSASKDDKDYSYLDSKYRFLGCNHEILKKYIAMQRKLNAKKIVSRGLIICDDVLGSENFNKDNSIWLDIFANYRHIGISLICALQAPVSLPTTMRAMIRYGCVYKYIDERSRDHIFNNFGSLCKNKDAFLEIYDKFTDEEYKFLFFNRKKIFDASNVYCGARAPAPEKIPKFKLEF
jgi:hypothetical protein